jgi:dihydrolipoamide dehydrogenase
MALTKARRHQLIVVWSVIALAVTAGLKVTDIVESVLVHPSLAEALADAAE